jgi:hypothetical protein
MLAMVVSSKEEGRYSRLSRKLRPWMWSGRMMINEHRLMKADKKIRWRW